jgi:hypothetical protein
MEPPTLPEEISFGHIKPILEQVLRYTSSQFNEITKRLDKLNDQIATRPTAEKIMTHITDRYNVRTAAPAVDIELVREVTA